MALALQTVDLDFVQAMIAHHEAAVQMSRGYLAAPPGQRSAAVSDLARNVITAQTAEIAQMRGWLQGHARTTAKM